MLVAGRLYHDRMCRHTVDGQKYVRWNGVQPVDKLPKSVRVSVDYFEELQLTF